MTKKYATIAKNQTAENQTNGISSLSRINNQINETRAYIDAVRSVKNLNDTESVTMECDNDPNNVVYTNPNTVVNVQKNAAGDQTIKVLAVKDGHVVNGDTATSSREQIRAFSATRTTDKSKTYTSETRKTGWSVETVDGKVKNFTTFDKESSGKLTIPKLLLPFFTTPKETNPTNQNEEHASPTNQKDASDNSPADQNNQKN